jgi:hypothetical protein
VAAFEAPAASLASSVSVMAAWIVASTAKGPQTREKLDAYQHKGPWTNRLVLGDSLQLNITLENYERARSL